MAQAEGGDSIFSADEYNVQYFGFPPQAFMNGMYNAILEYLHEGISALNDTILNMFAGKVTEEELKKHSYKQGQIAVDRLDTYFEKAESYLCKNVFSVPPHVLLPEDKVHADSPFSVEDMAKLDKDIQTVTEKIIRVKYSNTCLAEQLSETESIQTELETSLKTLQTTHAEVSSQSKKFVETADSLKHVNRLLDSVKLE